MRVDGKWLRTIWRDGVLVKIIDQRALPHEFIVEDLRTAADMAAAIKDMHVRGAGLIGASAAFGVALAAQEHVSAGLPPDAFLEAMKQAGDMLIATRPTAVNLERAVKIVLEAVNTCGATDVLGLTSRAWEEAQRIADEDADWCKKLGEHGLALFRQLAAQKNGKPLNVLTHCNAGWLAFVDYGSATSPIYAAHDAGVPLHVYVDETRPRNQGAALTAWELGRHGVSHTVIADNTGGHLMQHGMVDVVITGADRVTRQGDVCNKIGTYLKALAAKDNQVPFYVALPSSTFDFRVVDGVSSIPIELRDETEVTTIQGLHQETGRVVQVQLTPKGSRAANYAFDVTPNRLVKGLITERGICNANEASIMEMFNVNDCEHASKKQRVQ